MTRTAKVIVWIIVILIIIVIGKTLWGGNVAQAPSTTEAPAQKDAAQESGLKTAGKDTSDTALDKDMASIDAEVNALGADGATADEALAEQ